MVDQSCEGKQETEAVTSLYIEHTPTEKKIKIH
jgi:hypothetical protein